MLSSLSPKVPWHRSFHLRKWLRVLLCAGLAAAAALFVHSLALVKQGPLEKLVLSPSNPNLINIMVLIGTRPELVKMAPVIHELRRRKETFACTVVSTGQHKDMLQQLLDVFHLSDAVNVSLGLMSHDQTLPLLSSRVMSSMSNIFN
jgi:hypothetical protein